MVWLMNQAFFAQRPESTKATRHWSAHLELGFRRGRQRTELTQKKHLGPLRVQRLFYPDPNGRAHCYLLHPPGGVVLGDDLRVKVEVASGIALLTTPSAGRFYTVADFREPQTQRVQLQATAGLIEWLPQETILFSGANARLHTDIDLGAEAALAFWEILVLGRPAAGEAFATGTCEQRLRIRRCGEPLLYDQLRLRAKDPIVNSPQGLRGASTVGVATFTGGPHRDLLEHWLETVNGATLTGDFSVTQRRELVIARYLGNDAMRCREGFSRLWRDVTEDRDGAQPSEPRIWHT